MTQLEIYNYSLTLLGADRLTLITDDVVNRHRLDVVHVPNREALLREHPWNCATVRVLLVSHGTAPIMGYDYRHSLPSDCLRYITIYNGTGETDTLEDFRVEEGFVISNESTLYTRYVKKISGDSLQVDLAIALATRDAREIAYAVTSSKSTVESMEALYIEKLALAKINDAQESPKDEKVDEDEFIDGRQ